MIRRRRPREGRTRAKATQGEPLEIKRTRQKERRDNVITRWKRKRPETATTVNEREAEKIEKKETGINSK